MRVKGRTIAEYVNLPISEALKVFEGLQLTDREAIIAERILREIQDRLRFLHDVGVGYLTLGRERRDALGRRGAAHPAGDADWRQSDRRALRARRAVDRTAPARQPEAARHACPGFAISATPSSSWSTMKRRFGRPTTSSISVRVPVSTAAQVIFQGTPAELIEDRAAGSLTGAYLTLRASIPTPKARRPR